MNFEDLTVYQLRKIVSYFRIHLLEDFKNKRTKDELLGICNTLFEIKNGNKIHLKVNKPFQIDIPENKVRVRKSKPKKAVEEKPKKAVEEKPKKAVEPKPKKASVKAPEKTFEDKVNDMIKKLNDLITPYNEKAKKYHELLIKKVRKETEERQKQGETITRAKHLTMLKNGQKKYDDLKKQKPDLNDKLAEISDLEDEIRQLVRTEYKDDYATMTKFMKMINPVIDLKY
jgi:hypothetical protein